ncbi:MAG TPA: 16S rRNA (guanine(527)-N(7))-methyltransferase RsmG [Flavobacteriaceae bacterium]|jgi:16S rRNA (guanine527-N7)-methyltransferase|nr:16S rRNA (guanine(527)-N(7))-methyltransferase RsmG [Flavobacteriaceae bacterium]
MNQLIKAFPNLSQKQQSQFKLLESLYQEWNAQINVISRKDMNDFYERHVLHALGIAKVIDFKPGARVLDVGTGGGFPGIPLAILFPETHFYLIDSIGKKIKVVHAVQESLGLKNVQASQLRAEDFKEKVDFVVSRAVAKMDSFVPWIQKNIRSTHKHNLKNGILYLKGGDLTEELASFPKAQEYDLNPFFSTPFFETKKVVYLPL